MLQGLLIHIRGNVGIGTASPRYKLTVNGTAWCTASAWASDIRWKKDITSLNDPLRKLLRLRGVEFDWNREEFKDMNFPEGKQIGIIAREMGKEFPELVTTDKDGYKAIAHDRLLLRSWKLLKLSKESSMTRKVKCRRRSSCRKKDCRTEKA